MVDQGVSEPDWEDMLIYFATAYSLSATQCPYKSCTIIWA